MYPGLAYGAAEVIAECGTPEQQKRYVEQHAQRHVGRHHVPHRAARGLATWARPRPPRRSNADGTYSIRGTKIFISGGDHDLAENIIHLVLARIEGAPPGTKGLSLFIVPKLRVNADGSAGQPTTSRWAPSSTRWASTARPPACSTSARTTAAWASWWARVENVGHEPDVPDDERRAHRAWASRAWRSRRPRTSTRSTTRRTASRARDFKHVEGPDRAARADHRAPGRAPHAARDEGPRGGHPRAGREARHAHATSAQQLAGKDDEQAAYHQRPGGAAHAAGEGYGSRPGVPARARRPSRSTAAPASSRTTRSSSTAATRRSSPSTRAPTTSRRWTWWAARWARPAARTSSSSWATCGAFIEANREHTRVRRGGEAARRGAGGR